MLGQVSREGAPRGPTTWRGPWCDLEATFLPESPSFSLEGSWPRGGRSTATRVYFYLNVPSFLLFRAWPKGAHFVPLPALTGVHRLWINSLAFFSVLWLIYARVSPSFSPSLSSSSSSPSSSSSFSSSSSSTHPFLSLSLSLSLLVSSFGPAIFLSRFSLPSCRGHLLSCVRTDGIRLDATGLYQRVKNLRQSRFLTPLRNRTRALSFQALGFNLASRIPTIAISLDQLFFSFLLRGKWKLKIFTITLKAKNAYNSIVRYNTIAIHRG